MEKLGKAGGGARYCSTSRLDYLPCMHRALSSIPSNAYKLKMDAGGSRAQGQEPVRTPGDPVSKEKLEAQKKCACTGFDAMY